MRYYSVEFAAKALGCSPMTVRRALDAGHMASIEIIAPRSVMRGVSEFALGELARQRGVDLKMPVDAGKPRRKPARGERNGSAKLTASQADSIRRESAGGASYRTLGHRYGVSQTTIANIVKRKVWR